MVLTVLAWEAVPGMGGTCFSSSLLWALNLGCIPSFSTQLLASSSRIIIDPLDMVWELTTVPSCLARKEMTIAVAG